MKNFGKLNTVILAVLLCSFIPVFGMAQEVRHVSVTPLQYELEAERGAQISDTIRVLNSSETSSTRVVMETEDLSAEGEEGGFVFHTSDDELDVLVMSRWISFEPAEFVLEPREEKSVTFTIDIPENATPGGHYAGIFARVPRAEDAGGVAISPRVASLVLLSVEGEMVEDLSVLDFKTSKGYYEGGEVVFEPRFENAGTVHLRPDATITVTNILGQQVAEIPVEKRNVLPNSVRRIPVEWDGGMLWAGQYTATINGVYGSDNLPLNSLSVTFWAFPWKAGLGILLAIIFFILTRKRWFAVLRILVKGEAGL